MRNNGTGLLRTEKSDKSSLKWFNLSSGLKVKNKSTMQSIWDRKNNAWNGQSQSKVLLAGASRARVRVAGGWRGARCQIRRDHKTK